MLRVIAARAAWAAIVCAVAGPAVANAQDVAADAAPAAQAGSAGEAGSTAATQASAERSADIARLASAALLTDLVESDQRAIAVGERGHVLVSESRSDWRQVEGVPTRTLLTAATSVGDDVWAVGHDQVVLHSGDGGLTWSLQFSDPYDPDDFDDFTNGAPLLDVLFLDAQRGFAIGAYGLFLRTDDGGASWDKLQMSELEVAAESEAPPVENAEAISDDPDAVDEEDDSWTFSEDELALEELSDPHLNAIARAGDALFVVAERGSAYRSRDDGETWQRLRLPYAGSMFGVIGYGDGRVLVFGLRGNAFESSDLGDSWTALDTGTELSLQGGSAFGDGGAVLVGNNGLVLIRRGADGGFESRTTADGGVLADVLPHGGELILAGENGLSRLPAN